MEAVIPPVVLLYATQPTDGSDRLLVVLVEISNFAATESTYSCAVHALMVNFHSNFDSVTDTGAGAMP
jgi:hypothetical protein